MSNAPCSIIIVANNSPVQHSRVLEALRAGAVDVLETPLSGPDSNATSGAMLKLKMEAIERSLAAGFAENALTGRAAPSMNTAERLVAIGASAGGPAALATILGELPASFRSATIIVQHVDAQFASVMARWLGEKTGLTVRLARQGDRPEGGTVLIANSNDHLAFTGPHLLGYCSEPSASINRPSIDVFFHSVVRYWKGAAVGVLLTGMGRDGASGLKALRQAGFLTIAQDAASSAVYGMPKAAAELDAAVKILSINEIATALIKFDSSRNVNYGTNYILER